jgi:histone H3/H4
MPEIGLAAAYRIIKRAGAERVGDDAAEALRNVMEEVGLRIARHAVELATHAGRKTVKEADVKLAVKSVLRE